MSAYVGSSAAEERLSRVEAITETALAHLHIDDLLEELLDRVREFMGVDTAAVLLLDRSGERLVATAAKGVEAEVRQGFRLPVGSGFAGHIAAEKKPLVLDRIDQTTVRNPVLWEAGLASLLGVPMLSGGAVTGVLHVGTLAPRQFTDEDADLLQRVAGRIALAVQARGSELDHAAAEALQHSLLPARLLTRPDVDTSARYVPGEEAGVGGDWYDVFDLPSGAIGLVIGDVAGRGLDAATVMDRLRSALRAYALESEDPGEVLHKLDRKIDYFERGTMVTVIYAVFEPGSERLRVSVAGHLSPVMSYADRTSIVLDMPADPPLGVPVEARRRTHTVDMPAGALLCLYTDGLVERRRTSIDDNVERLRASVTSDNVETVCINVMAQLVGDTPAHDDIALLVVRNNDGSVTS